MFQQHRRSRVSRGTIVTDIVSGRRRRIRLFLVSPVCHTSTRGCDLGITAIRSSRSRRFRIRIRRRRMNPTTGCGGGGGPHRRQHHLLGWPPWRSENTASHITGMTHCHHHRHCHHLPNPGYKGFAPPLVRTTSIRIRCSSGPIQMKRQG